MYIVVIVHCVIFIIIIIIIIIFIIIIIEAAITNIHWMKTKVRPDFLYSLVYDNFFQTSNVGGRNKNKNKMSQNKVISILNMK